ncbi:GntR family transcriptional regulator [Streptomyces sp. MB09-02B]|uniref:GntR family transcriptional regulator n=1 Tax=Streptomyces sp. MB09-02B TaxID=3028667 RepID=UPI0029A19803|nr:GntR family transcriptional regulator [Streptomyces sp. MB09-02B]MDX3640295.1 GntR family transcriptional regulator [Streptomyces sp. MB09-02B]
MIEIDRESITPMYVQLASVLRERIRRGDIPVGRRIPSYYELEQQTGGAVSRRTIKSAIEALAAEGIVQGVQGKGVFVIAKPGDGPPAAGRPAPDS